MVSSTHEALHRFFQDRPDAIDRMFRAVGFGNFPDTARARVLPNDVTEIKPIERRVDTAMRIESTDGCEYILVFEAQGKKDEAKLDSWPYYVEYLANRHHCPVVLVVICQDASTAKWARGPIYRETSFWIASAFYPLVLGPENVPTVAKLDAHDLLTLGPFSVIVHGNAVTENELARVAHALALERDREIRADLSIYVEIGLGTMPAVEIWRKMMSMDYETLLSAPRISEILGEHDDELKAECKAEARAEGRVEGQAEYLLLLLDNRRVVLTVEERARIDSCTDEAQLRTWYSRAFDAASGAELFG